MLTLRNLHAWYGKSHILQGVDLTLKKGEIVALLGRNGAGRSSCCKAIMGELVTKGTIALNGQDIRHKKPYEIARLGIGYVPENRDIFPGLSTRQNLILGAKSGNQKHNKRWNIEDIFQLFPNLKQRADVDAAVLSGGEKQMLALSRTLMGNPDVLMVDEPTEGLAPQLVAQLATRLQQIAAQGVAILLVEQKLSIALEISHRLYVMGQGKIVYHGTIEQFKANREVQKQWLWL